jgi:hypothetical protein
MRGHTTPFDAPVTTHAISWQALPKTSRPSSEASPPSTNFVNRTAGDSRQALDEEEDLDSEDDLVGEMSDRRPDLHHGHSHQPLLHKDDDDENRGRPGLASSDPSEQPPLFTRRSIMRSRSPDTQAKLATRKKYTYAAFFLGLSLVSFVIQTETAVYIQHKLRWNKAYCML